MYDPPLFFNSSSSIDARISEDQQDVGEQQLNCSRCHHLLSSCCCYCRNRCYNRPWPFIARRYYRRHCAMAMLLFLLFLQITLIIAAEKQYHTSQGSTVDRRYELQILRRLLAAGYTYYARPLTTDNGTLEVRTRISLIKIQNLWERTDVKTEALEVTMRIQLNWCDGALSWVPEDFGGVDYVIIPGDRLWIPDIQIINALDDVYALIRDRRFDFKLHSDGCVWWFPTGTIFTRCELDLSYFPFDIQRCPIVFESAMYPKEFLNLTVRYDKSAVSLKTFTESGQWDLITAYAIPKLNYVTTSTAFSRVEITLEIRRKTLYYKINVFFPCAMLSALQILTFFLPIGSEDRISQSTTILLSVVVFQSIVVGELPRTSNSTPLLCLYIDFLTGISVVTVADAILGVYVLNHTNRNGCLARCLQFVVLLGQNQDKKTLTANDRIAQLAAKSRQNQSSIELSNDDIELVSQTPLNSATNNAIIDKFALTRRTGGTTLINEDAACADAFEEDSLDALSRHGECVSVSAAATPTITGDLFLSQPGSNKNDSSNKPVVSNHTFIANKSIQRASTANYGTTATTNVMKPPLPRRSSSCNIGFHAAAPVRKKAPRLATRKMSLHQRILEPFIVPNNIRVTTSRRSGGIGGVIGNDDDEVSVGTNALRTAAVCIDNFVFFIALISSIMIPFYMFNVLPPTS